MDGVRQCVSDASDRTKSVCACAQVSLRSQVLEGVAFFGNRIRLWVIHVANQYNVRCLNLDRLTAAL